MTTASLFLALLAHSVQEPAPKPMTYNLSIYRLLPNADLSLQSVKLDGRAVAFSGQVSGPALQASIEHLKETQEIQLVSNPTLRGLSGMDAWLSVSGGTDSFTVRCNARDVGGKTKIQLALASPAVSPTADPGGFFKAPLGKQIMYSEGEPAIWVLRQAKEPYWLVVVKPAQPPTSKDGAGG